MLIEVRRYRRRMLGGGGRTPGATVAFLTLGAICYVALLMIVGSGNGSIPPQGIVMIQTGLFSLAAPIVLNGAIAGEREKGTWDLLLVAPVTKAQIMIGKFAGALTNLLFGAGLFLLPIFICAVSYQQTNYENLCLAELDSIAFALFACALSLLFSARCRRGFTALGMSLGALILGIIVYPLLIGMVGGADRDSTDLYFALHPFYVESLLTGGGSQEKAATGVVTLACIQIVAFVFLTIVALVWTEKTLTYSDTQTRFLPKSHAGS